MSESTWEDKAAAPVLDEKNEPAPAPPADVQKIEEEKTPLNPPGFGAPAGWEILPQEKMKIGAPRYKVEPPAARFEWQGLTIYNEFTEVPEERIGPLLSAALAAGVTLTAEEIP